MSQEKGEDGNGLPWMNPDLLKSQKPEENDVVTTSTDTTPTPPQSNLLQEYTINVPLVRPKPAFLEILQSAGAKGEVFTKKEICFYLKEYIGSRLLYDPTDPRVVHCQHDPLGQVFQLDRFTINDVFELLAKHCNPMPDSCIKRRRHVLSAATQHQNRQLLFRTRGQQPESYFTGVPSSVALSISVRSQSPISSTTTTTTASEPVSSGIPDSQNAATSCATLSSKPQGESKAKKKRSRGKSSSECEDRPSKRKTVVRNPNEAESTSGYPWYFTVKMETSDESEVLSVQGKETVRVKDSSDDLWFLEEDQISVHIDTDDTFSVEYEVDSNPDTDVILNSSDATSSTSEDVLVVCGDSDVEFWADSSSSSDSDEELTEADKWQCAECDNVNTPVQRYCGRCWKLRPGWLPEFQNRSFFRRSNSAPGGLSSSDSECRPKRRRTKQRSSRSGRQTSDVNTELFTSSHLSSISSSSSSSSSSHQKLKQSQNYTLPASTAVKSERTDPELTTGLSRYDSGIGMGAGCSISPSQYSQKSPSVDDDKHKFGEKAKETVEVRTTLSNYQSTLSEQFKDLCMICLSKPKNSCIIHGKTSHQVCCYSCAKTLKKRGRTCPVCRRAIKHVTKNYLM